MRILRFVLLALVCACHNSQSQVPAPAPVPVGTLVACPANDCGTGDQLKITYLGVGGILVESGSHALLTGPHFTNPSLGRVVPARYGGTSPAIEANRALIGRLLPAAASHARTILIGHGHYDHLMDVPFIADSLAIDATIYGGPSVRNMLLGDPMLRTRVVAIGGDSVGRFDHVGTWITSGDRAFRFMALRADHARTASLFGKDVLFAPETVPAPMQALPRRAEDWKLGEPYTYLIDVLAPDGTTPVFRIFFQDAANTAPLGFPPFELNDRRVDLAILCVPNSQDVNPRAPDGLLWVLHPRYVIASHWENFFRPQTIPIRIGTASDVNGFVGSLKRNLPTDAKWAMPNPMTAFSFPLSSR